MKLADDIQKHELAGFTSAERVAFARRVGFDPAFLNVETTPQLFAFSIVQQAQSGGTTVALRRKVDELIQEKAAQGTSGSLPPVSASLSKGAAEISAAAAKVLESSRALPRSERAAVLSDILRQVATELGDLPAGT
jgi:hypothetical protein